MNIRYPFTLILTIGCITLLTGCSSNALSRSDAEKLLREKKNYPLDIKVRMEYGDKIILVAMKWNFIKHSNKN